MFKGNKEIERALYALNEQLAAEGVGYLEIEEMEIAARWCIKLNSSKDFKERLNVGLMGRGYRNVAERI